VFLFRIICWKIKDRIIQHKKNSLLPESFSIILFNLLIFKNLT
jgi:hypothetical protein